MGGCLFFYIRFQYNFLFFVEKEDESIVHMFKVHYDTRFCHLL